MKKEHGMNQLTVIDTVLNTVPGAKKVRAHITQHTRYASSRDWLLELDLKKMPDFYTFPPTR
jgi:hypothetical protein